MFKGLKVLLLQTTYKSMITVTLTLILSILIYSSKSYGDYATVLIYHKFDEPKTPSTSIPIKDFEMQMRYLKENNFNVISIEKLIWYIQNKKDIPEKTVVITIDDGYRSTMKAYSVLKRYNFPFTVFLYMEGIGRYPDFLTLEEIEILKKDKLVTFGNHSYSHKRFGRMIKNMDKEEFKRMILDDTRKAEERLENLLGFKPKIYAFPYGEYNKVYINTLKELGYTALFTQDPSNVTENSPLLRINRQPVVGRWGKIDHFIKILNTEALDVDYHYPEIGFIEKNPLPYIKIKLKNPNKYKNCEIYISEHGWVWAKEEKGYLYWKNPPKLKREKNRIGVKCRNKDTGNIATYFYLIFN
ncbi:polysaccharide deacetylase family protein [Persephonella sp.]